MKKLLVLVCLAPCFVLLAQDKDEKNLDALLKQIDSKLHYQKGEVTLRGDLAKLTVPDNLRFLGPDDADFVLTKLWGNPGGEKTLGMVLPSDISPVSSNCWGVVITYDEDGYVKDSDADKINYDKLLKEMKAGTVQANKERK